METLLSKRRAAAMRGLPNADSESPQNRAEWSAVEEGFRLLERDLGKLQVSVNSSSVLTSLPISISLVLAICRDQRPGVPQDPQEV